MTYERLGAVCPYTTPLVVFTPCLTFVFAADSETERDASKVEMSINVHIVVSCKGTSLADTDFGNIGPGRKVMKILIEMPLKYRHFNLINFETPPLLQKIASTNVAGAQPLDLHRANKPSQQGCWKAPTFWNFWSPGYALRDRDTKSQDKRTLAKQHSRKE